MIWDDFSNSGAVTPGVWQHVAVTYNATSDLITFYRDGQVVGTGSHSLGINASLADLFIGWQTNGDNGTFNGEMDELRIWNVERSISEIQNDLFIPLNGNEPNLVAYYRFDQTGTTNLNLRIGVQITSSAHGLTRLAV